jgi:DNA-binding MarR family transcriptional regulator
MEESIIFEDTASYKLARVTTAFRTALERHMGAIGLHGGQVFVLFELWKSDGLRQVDIAEKLNLKAPTVNKMLKGLAEINLVEISRTEKDGRSSRVFLTEKGLSIRSDVSGQWVELEAEYLSGLTETERHILPELLGKLKAAYTGQEESVDDE